VVVKGCLYSEGGEICYLGFGVVVVVWFRGGGLGGATIVETPGVRGVRIV